MIVLALMVHIIALNLIPLHWRPCWIAVSIAAVIASFASASFYLITRG